MGFRVYGLGFRVYLTGLVGFKRHLQVVYTLLMQLLKDFGLEASTAENALIMRLLNFCLRVSGLSIS